MKKPKRYKFIFHGKGNYDLIGAKDVLLQHGIKLFKRTRDLKVRNK